MTSSPYNPKKARASLTCNISTFFEPGETSTIDHSENFTDEPNLDSQPDIEKSPENEDQYLFSKNLNKDQITISSDKRLKSPIMNQIFLFSINRRNTSQGQQPADSISAFNINGKKPLIISELPQPFFSSKCFQTFDSHQTQDLAILNLYDTAKLVRPFDEDILITRLLASETFLGSVGLGKGRLDGYFMTSDLSSHVCVYELENRKRLRKYSVVRPARNFASRIQQDKTQLYCGFTDGSIRVFDIRMKTNVFYFPNSSTAMESPHQTDAVVFNPLTSLEMRDDYYLLGASTNKICLWDLRKGANVCKVEDGLGKGSMKGLYYPSETQRCVVTCYGGKELKTVDLMTGRVSVLVEMEDPVQDFVCFEEAGELFVLTGKEKKGKISEENAMQGGEVEINEEKEDNKTSSAINIFKLQGNGVREVSKIEMGKEYNDMRVNKDGTRLWVLGSERLALWDYIPREEEGLTEEGGENDVGIC